MILEAATPLSISREHFATTVSALNKTLSNKQMLPASGLIAASLDRSGRGRVPLSALDALMFELGEAVEDPLLLIKAYSKLNYSSDLLRKTYLASALTRRDALHLMCRYFRINTQGVEISFHDAPENLLRVDSVNHHDTADAQREAVVYGLVRTMQSLGISNIQYVTLGGQSAKSLCELETLFPARVRLGEPGRATISVSPNGLDELLGWRSCSVELIAKRERQLLRLDKMSDWSESVRALLPLLCRQGEADIDQCAGLLAVSRRSLQRHIKDNGAVFRDLLELARRDQARIYLAQHFTIDEVALLLGYRQSSQFYRAFRQWFDCSPADFRHAMAGLTAPP